MTSRKPRKPFRVVPPDHPAAPITRAVRDANLTGNVIPPRWYHELRHGARGQSHTSAMAILADVWSAYRGTTEYDEEGEPYARIWMRDGWFHRSASQLAERYCLGIATVRRAIDYLTERGLIEVRVVPVERVGGRTFYNQQYIRPVVPAIVAISAPLEPTFAPDPDHVGPRDHVPPISAAARPRSYHDDRTGVVNLTTGVLSRDDRSYHDDSGGSYHGDSITRKTLTREPNDTDNDTKATASPRDPIIEKVLRGYGITATEAEVLLARLERGETLKVRRGTMNKTSVIGEVVRGRFSDRLDGRDPDWGRIGRLLPLAARHGYSPAQVARKIVGLGEPVGNLYDYLTAAFNERNNPPTERSRAANAPIYTPETWRAAIEGAEGEEGF